MTSRIVPVDLRGSPQSVYARLAAGRRCVLLESSLSMPGLSGWSYITGPAVATLRTEGTETVLRAGDADGPEHEEPWHRWQDPFAALAALLPRPGSAVAAQADDSALPRPGLVGGWVGSLGYDLGRHVERLPSIAQIDPDIPPLHLRLCDHLLAFEHDSARWFFCTTPVAAGWPVSPSERLAVWAETLAVVREPMPESGDFTAGPAVSRTPTAQYLAQVRQVLDYIAQGDIFQANLSHRLEATFAGDPYALYCTLTALNPSPFSAYLPIGPEASGALSTTIAGVSPERFLKLDGREVTARPIKGTRARAADETADVAQREALRTSVKDRAENLMIVDLMRNDLGRIAEVGSVHVDELFGIEPHPSVWQMVSTVRARLREGADAAALLRACWPPGSMTGAPKVRAMEIIESLEPVRRGPYAGAIGYVDVSGDMDWSVVIRTAVVHGERVMVQVGGAVVADSDPQQELDETYAKGRLLLRALQPEVPAAPLPAGLANELVPSFDTEATPPQTPAARPR